MDRLVAEVAIVLTMMDEIVIDEPCDQCVLRAEGESPSRPRCYDQA